MNKEFSMEIYSIVEPSNRGITEEEKKRYVSIAEDIYKSLENINIGQAKRIIKCVSDTLEANANVSLVTKPNEKISRLESMMLHD